MIAEVLLIVYCAHPSFGITVKIDGFIDLGSKWNYEFPGMTNNDQQQYKLVETASRTRTLEKSNDSEKSMDDLKIGTNDTKDNNDTNYEFDLSSIFESNETSKKGVLGDKMITQPSLIDAHITKKNKQLNKTKPSLKENIRSKHNLSRHSKRHKTEKNKFDAVKETFSDHENLNFEDLTTKIKKKNKRNGPNFVTINGYVSKEVYRARKVKEDTKVYDFTVHIYKQTLKVFDDIKKKTNNIKLKRKVSALKRSYEEKFSDFLKQTYNHTLKTNLGTQKVILNTIDMSNKLLQRLINHLLHDMDREILRTNLGTVNVFQKEVDREKELENKHACTKLGVCRLNDDYSDFVVDILAIILQTDDRKIKQAADALTEALKNADFGDIMHYDLQIKLKKSMEEVELWDSFKSRAIFVVLKNVIKNKNKPIVIMENQENYLANKTIAFHNIINILNEKLPKSENEKEWASIKKDLTEWKEGRYNNISLIADNIVKNLILKALIKQDYDNKMKFNENMKVLLAHIK